MSYFHLINENEEPKQNIYVDNINMEGDIENAKIKVQNGDIVDLSSLPDHGVASYRLTSNGNGSVSWVAGTGTSGIEYDGSQPVQLGKLAKYNASDGSLVDETSFIDTDILLKDGSVAMIGNLNMNNQQIELTSSIKTSFIEPNASLDPNNINIQSNGVNFNAEFVNCNGQPLKEIEWRFTRQGVNYGNFGTENGVFFFGNFGNASVNTEIRGANNEKLVIDDSTAIPECRLENLNLDMTNKSIIDVFDVKTNNSVRTNIINANSGNAITLNPSGGFNVEVNSNLNMNFNDITEVNNLETLNISSSGVNITINDPIDANGNNIDNVNNMNVSSINSITPVGGLYSGISNGVVINQASLQTDLLPVSSVGSLLIPANGFKVGDAYHLVIAGIFPDEAKNDQVEIQIKQNGTILGSVTLEYEDFDTVESNFEIEADFIIRSVGITGSLSTNIDFTFNKKVTKDFKGTRTTNITTINTTTASSLSVLANVTGANSSIQSRLAYLRKQY